MTQNKITLSDFAENDWKDYSLYTLNERALPSIVDGLKPSQRFIIYSTLLDAKDKFIKIVEIAGPISSYGYHHGEVSAQDAAVKMAQPWNNNYPLLEGRGNYGSRMIQKSGAPRYIYAKLHKNFNNLFADNHLCPSNKDKEVKIPEYYLPLIPVVLLNGISGTATGYSTNILPYDLKEVAKLCKDHLQKKNISNKELTPSFPNFKGTIEKNKKGGWDLIGTYTLLSKTKLLITELPFQYDRETYINILNDLEEKEIINDYVDQCENGFKFLVTLKRDYTYDIEKDFKLRKPITENLNVIDQYGKLKEYNSPIELIKDFCDFRITYVQKRIDKKIVEINEAMALLISKIKFIKAVIDNKIVFKQKSKIQLVDDLTNMKFNKLHIPKLLDMNFYHLTLDEIEKFNQKYEEYNKELTYYKNTTAQKEYLIDIDNILKNK